MSALSDAEVVALTSISTPMGVPSVAPFPVLFSLPLPIGTDFEIGPSSSVSSPVVPCTISSSSEESISRTSLFVLLVLFVSCSHEEECRCDNSLNNAASSSSVVAASSSSSVASGIACNDRTSSSSSSSSRPIVSSSSSDHSDMLEFGTFGAAMLGYCCATYGRPESSGTSTIPSSSIPPRNVNDEYCNSSLAPPSLASLKSPPALDEKLRNKFESIE